MSVLRTGRGRAGGGGGEVEFLTEKKISAKKCSWGLKTQKFFSLLNFFGGGDFGVFGAPHAPPGGRAGSENDTLLPMAMTCDRLKFWSWSGLAVNSYHPETLAAEEEKKILTKP